MRHYIIASVAAVSSIAFAQFASAADLPVKVPVYQGAYNWNGFHVGGNIGYSWGHGDSWYADPGLAGAGLPTAIFGSQNLDGIIGGGQIGYNWLYQDIWVLGVEADFQGSGEKGSSSFSDPYCADCNAAPNALLSGTVDSKIHWFGTVRARAGLLVNPTLLVYATGGLAYGRISTSGTITDSFVPTTWSFGDSTTKFGWTLGGGIEGAIPSTMEWTWKVEYLYIDFGSVSGSGIDADFGSTYNWNVQVTDNIVRVGVNYRFH